ncbi:MAG: hypothetical protein WDO13_21895 [Verrucomicrobiota bacterium]
MNGNGVANFLDPDDKVTLQILRIGANIIDQWDADSFPTTITYSPPGGTGAFNVEGIEDLPYPFAAYLNVYAPNTDITGPSSIPTGVPPFNFYLYFGLWNPHQPPSSVTTSNYPAAFRFFPFFNSALPNASDSFVAGFWNTGLLGNTASASWFLQRHHRHAKRLVPG